MFVLVRLLVVESVLSASANVSPIMGPVGAARFVISATPRLSDMSSRPGRLQRRIWARAGRGGGGALARPLLRRALVLHDAIRAWRDAVSRDAIILLLKPVFGPPPRRAPANDYKIILAFGWSPRQEEPEV